jgi:hypothetical protein
VKITIRNKPDDDSESVMELYLGKSFGGVELRGVDSNGRDWIIARIEQDGIRLMDSIPASSDWPLDERGRLKCSSV